MFVRWPAIVRRLGGIEVLFDSRVARWGSSLVSWIAGRLSKWGSANPGAVLCVF